MKRSTVVAAMAIGLVCVAGAGFAQDANTSHPGRVVVTAAPAQFRTYVVNLDTGYALQVLVGNTHRQFMQAQRAAEHSEALRVQGQATSPFVTVALDNSSGPGSARRFLLADPSQGVVAVVDAFCKQSNSVGRARCRMVDRHVAGNPSGQSLASRNVGRVQLAVLGTP